MLNRIPKAALAAVVATLLGSAGPACAAGAGGGPETEAPPASDAAAPSAPADTAWIWLFDGRSTDEWRNYKRDGISDGWQIVDGALTRVGSAGDIITRRQFESFELELEWMVEPGGNSGIFFRVVEADDARSVWESGPEYQILDNAGHRDGQSPETSAASVYDLYPPVQDASRPAGEWNTARIVAHGDHVEHWLNGVKVVEYVIGSDDWNRRVAASKFRDLPHFGVHRRGHIALQDHGDVVAYRDIRIRPL